MILLQIIPEIQSLHYYTFNENDFYVEVILLNGITSTEAL